MKRREILTAALFTSGAAGAAIRSSDQHHKASAWRTKKGLDPASPTAVRKGYLDGPFGQIHYYEAGVGPCLIMSHQSPVSGRMFERAMPFLSALGLRAIAVDTPGYGNSDIPANPPTIPEYANAFEAVLDELHLEQAHFLGHHTGASILCHFAARHPGRVRSLILNGPPLLSADELRAARERISPGPHPIHADGSHLQERWDRRVQFSPGWRDKVAMHRRLVDQLWAGPTGWYGHRAALNYEMKPDLMALAGRVMILTNTGDDSYKQSRKAHELRPEFEFHALQAGTHDIVDEQPEAWSEAVARFVLAGA